MKSELENENLCKSQPWLKELPEIVKIRKRLKKLENNNWTSSIKLLQKHYVQDVSVLLTEIEQLLELLKDRDGDLEFEYNERIAAEKEVERLKDEYE